MAPKILQFEYHSTRDDDHSHDAKALYDDWGGGDDDDDGFDDDSNWNDN